MRKSVHFISLLLGTLSITIVAKSQSDRFAYAVTDMEQRGANWSFLRKLDLQTGDYSKVLLNGSDASLAAYDAATKKQLTAQQNDSRAGGFFNAAFGTGVAAMAYDKKNNRLYYTPMFVDQLRYVDLKTMKVFFVTGKAFTGMPQKSPDQGNIVTRMVIASDGNGYAMTNDGAHLIQFTTGKKSTITDLGTIADDPANKGFSIHSSCSSFGGDMIADNNDNLYVLSARNHVFKINLESKVATYLGTVSGLPANFTINGAAVNDNNQLVVSSAVEASSYFAVDAKTWSASPFKITGTVWHCSDLANSNLLNTKNPAAIAPVTEIASRTIPETGSGKIQLYPNPVTGNRFTIQFKQPEAGVYTVQVTDVTGRQVSRQIVNVSGDNQVQEINLNAKATKGIYLVKITGPGSRSVFSKKLVVQ